VFIPFLSPYLASGEIVPYSEKESQNDMNITHLITADGSYQITSEKKM
jgi:hypothetical protein